MKQRDFKRLKEAKAAIERLTRSLGYCPHNRLGQVGQNHYDAIARHKAVVREIEDKSHAR